MHNTNTDRDARERSIQTRLSTITRRRALGLSAAAFALYAGPLRAQDAGNAATEAAEEAVPADDGATPFSFDWLIDRMQQRAQRPDSHAQLPEGFLSDLDYDDYRRIQFRPDHARWAGEPHPFRLHAYHLGWLFEEPVSVHEVVQGVARPVTFTTADFNYHQGVESTIPENAELPGIAGFRINAPLNRPDIYDEVVSFLGASYFRALGQGNTYGLSARGLAVNTATGAGEEFPRFTGFWVERPEPEATQVTFYAALESASLTGAYRFVMTPGETTRIDTSARIFLRESVEQVGVAPLTSMFLFGPSDKGDFSDYRPRVHDSDTLVIATDGDVSARPLQNPPRLANSYFSVENPRRFGLAQRERDFDLYLDAEAHYERRPSLIIEPVGDWGRGAIRLIEIPTDLETNDNIVAFWVPEGTAEAGETLSFDYRMHWGMSPPGARPTSRARVLRTLTGAGGVSGVEGNSDTMRKFVIDFQGGDLGELTGADDVTPEVTASRGTVAHSAVSRIDGTDIWRLVLDVDAPGGATVELRATLVQEDRHLTETWLYQWMKT